MGPKCLDKRDVGALLTFPEKVVTVFDRQHNSLKVHTQNIAKDNTEINEHVTVIKQSSNNCTSGLD